LDSRDARGVDPLDEAPAEVKATAGLDRDLGALEKYFEDDIPVTALVRPVHDSHVAYGRGDAAADGFGAGIQVKGINRIQHGTWKEEDSARGSNWREATNLANKVIRDLETGKLDGFEIWLATDNKSFSGCTNKGTSTSQQLFAVIVAMKLVVRKHSVFLHVIHVSGKRMIAMGYDGASRGDFETGVMTGNDIRQYLPLDKGAFDVAGESLRRWLKLWMGIEAGEPLSPEGWFTTGHRAGTHVWAPAPAAALDALEELSKSRMKRPFDVAHVILIPRLLYDEEWRRRFDKEVDFWFHMSTGEFWPNHCFEPLVVGICFKMRRDEPWLVRRAPSVVEFGRAMQKLSKSSNLEVGHHLRQFWGNPWGLP
jgi:hypothetical protein